MKTISIIIPLLNEEKSLPILIEALRKVTAPLSEYKWELLFVDDGSTDHSLDILMKMREEDESINIVELSRNFGKEYAMLAGLDYCKGDAAIIMDADMQHTPSSIPEMVKHWEEGYEDVYMRRVSRNKESWLRRKFSMMFYRILQWAVSFKVLENVGDFRLLDRCCIDALTEMRETARYTKGLYSWIGFKKKELVFEVDDRADGGTSKWSFASLLNLAIDGITSFSIAPLRMASLCGFIVALISIIYMIWTIIKTLIWGEPVAGYPTIITTILLLGGIQLIALGIIGEYVGRIYNETKLRPGYFVRSVNGKKKKDAKE